MPKQQAGGDVLNVGRWFQRRRARVQPSIDERCWQVTETSSEALQALSADDKARLRKLAQQFLATTRFSTANGLILTEAMRAHVALEACLPILELGLDRYRSVSSVLLYPSGFVVDQQWTDEAGVEHERAAELSGEAWQDGPVILAWDDVDTPESGASVVIHEFAHVLDAGNGRTNGFPPLDDPAAAEVWSAAFAAAYADHCARVDRGEEAYVDDYGAEDEAEFFAVVVECFFIWPENLVEGYPDVYDALTGFFRQDPARRRLSVA